MAFGGSNSGGLKGDINVTPLVDVVLVLLIIFMVVTPMLQRGKDVHLPKTNTSDKEKKPDVLVISIPSDRQIWLESNIVSKEALRDQVSQSLRSFPERKILVKGDDSLKVRDVRQVMAEARAGGAASVSLAVEQGHK
ncbi:MAG: biopolymer transporter ExbD [Myxococcales bacterium]|jgi:biopolymer transport protein ExbD